MIHITTRSLVGITVRAIMRHALLQGVRNKCEHLLALIQQQHDSQIPEAFVSEARACYELEAFDLAEMGLKAEHVYVEEFGDIVVSCVRVLLTERGTYSGGLLFDQGSLVCNGLYAA